jgi:uncharacterized protein YndB with AHSA1/START domain
MDKGITARVTTGVDASVAKVWHALVTPEEIKRYMFGTNVVSDWKEGAPITWKGEWQGKSFEDKGKILKMDPGHMLQYSHYSPLSGLPEKPENYHTVTIELQGQGPRTVVSLSQDNNPTDEARAHSEKNWTSMLEGLKKLLEK